MQFRSKTLANAIIEPKLTAKEWRNDVDNALSLAVFEEVQKIIAEVDTAKDFQ